MHSKCNLRVQWDAEVAGVSLIMLMNRGYDSTGGIYRDRLADSTAPSVICYC